MINQLIQAILSQKKNVCLVQSNQQKMQWKECLFTIVRKLLLIVLIPGALVIDLHEILCIFVSIIVHQDIFKILTKPFWY